VAHRLEQRPPNSSPGSKA